MIKIFTDNNSLLSVFYDEKTSQFKYFDSNNDNAPHFESMDETITLLNNLNVVEFFQYDNGLLNDFNDCWSDITLFNREIEYTSIKNYSSDVYFPFLLDKYGDRFIVPTTYFVIEFIHLNSRGVSLRLVNLQGSFLDLPLDELNLKEEDEIRIQYQYGNVLCYVNNELISKYNFSFVEHKGYITWRIPIDAFISYKNFKIFKNDLTMGQLFHQNIEIQNQYPSVLNELKELHEEFDFFKDKTESILHSTNFLFNNLYLDYKLSPNKLMEDVQVLGVELLSFVGNICDKYNLSWWLDYGTLLGAIRHDNFIPWDDDVDIGMMREDYNMFNNILFDEIERNNLEDLISVSYRKRKINGKTINSFTQIFIIHQTDDSDNGKIFAGVDIFPYDYLIDYDEDTIEETYYDAKMLFYNTLTEGNDLKSIYMGLTSETALNEYYKRLNLNFDSEYIIPGVEGACGPINLYDLFVLKKEDLFPLKQHKYSSKYFPIPNNYNLYLQYIYNDYMKVPLNIRTHGRVNNFRYDFEIDKLFKKDKNILSRVNLKFK